MSLTAAAVTVPVTSDGRHSRGHWDVAKRPTFADGLQRRVQYRVYDTAIIRFLEEIIDNKINPYVDRFISTRF